MRVRVHIATTEGPALAQRLAVEEGLSEIELSAACLDGTPTRLPIAGAYTCFVRDHVRALSGRAAYRLDLDRRVDGGDSWMLGAWIAHPLLAEGRLAMRDEAADLAVFATGEIAFSADARRRTEVRAVEHVAEKVARLTGRAAEEAAAGRRVLLIAPRGNAGEARAALARLPAPDRGRVAFHAIVEIGEARALLAPGSRGAATDAASCASSASRWLCAPLSERRADTFPGAAWKAIGGPSGGRPLLPIAQRPVTASGAVYRLDRPRSLCGFSARAAGADIGGHAWIPLRFDAGAGEVREALVPARRHRGRYRRRRIYRSIVGSPGPGR